jgi:hypothetical protein
MKKLLVLGALAAAAALPSRPGFAYEGPWCAIVTQGSEVIEELCSMQSFEMCRAEARRWGPTGFCRQNPRFPGYWATYHEPPPRGRMKRRYPQ